ncbi:MAG: amidohydrolase family protein, partial [Cyclobacteriaceae bacterium]|nr:amidohydrolase family protein [Cyclobacteriaceae bacterium]
QNHENVYADISAICNPDIYSFPKFSEIMKKLIDAGLENRLMFGSDNFNIFNCIESVKKLEFLSENQKQNIFSKNAERFFNKKVDNNH